MQVRFGRVGGRILLLGVAVLVVLPAVTGLVEHHFRRVLLEVAQEHLEAVGEPAELAAAQAEPDWDGNETESRASEPDRAAVS